MLPAVPSREVRTSRPPARWTVASRVGGVARGRGEVRPAEQQPAFGQRGDGQPVPRRDHLVVPGRTDPAAARGQQRVPDAGQAIRVGRICGFGPALQHRGAVLERAAIGDAEGPGRELAVLGPEDRVQLGGPPDVELSFFALAVGVQRRRQPAVAGPQLAQHPVARLFRHPAGQFRAGQAPQVGVDASQQGVVVEHLLEVRDHPAGVDRVPGEPAAELVVHAAAGHRLAGALGHPQRGRGPGPLVVAEQEFQHHRRRELRRAAEPPVGRVVVAVERLHRRVRGLAEPV